MLERAELNCGSTAVHNMAHLRATQNIQRAIKSEPNASASRWRSIVPGTGQHLVMQVVGKLNYLRLNVRYTFVPNQFYLHWNG